MPKCLQNPSVWMSRVHVLGGGFKYFLFSPLFGEDSHFDQYFSDGLKPPTSVFLPKKRPTYSVAQDSDRRYFTLFQGT